MDDAIVATGLTRSFGPTRALDGVSLTVPAGTVLGLLGPNGAGKTTTVKVLTTQLTPDSGTAEVLGHDVVTEAAAVRQRIGLAGQYAAVDERLTGRENLVMIGRLNHLDRSTAKERAARLLDRFDLLDAADRPVSGYSGGMRRRLDLSASLVNEPPVLFLDEPTTGLDPKARLDLWAVIEELVADGTTLLLTTQYLDEADRLADRIAVIDHGRVIAEGTSEELKRRTGSDVVAFTLDGEHEVQRAHAVLAGHGAVGHATTDGARLDVHTPDAAAVLGGLAAHLDAAGIVPIAVDVRRPTLDDVFLNLTAPTPAAAAPPAALSPVMQEVA